MNPYGTAGVLLNRTMQRPEVQSRPRGTRRKAAHHSDPSTAVCVLGMHRSGTSLVMRLLNLMGIYLGPPENLIHPNEYNPEGYWEHQDIVHLNEAILNCLGGSWDKPPEFPHGWEGSPELAALRRKARSIIHRDLQGVPLWGWKDPRNSLTLPFWQNLLPDIRYVICLRNPIDIASSLEKRDGLPFAKCIDLWLTYTTAAIKHTSGKPRILVFYENLFTDWQGELRRLAEFIERPISAHAPEPQSQAEAFVMEELRHHRSTLTDAVGASELAFTAKALYFSMCALAQGSASRPEGPMDGELEEALDIFSTYAKEEQATLKQKDALLAETDVTLADKNAALVEKDALLAEKDRRIASSEAMLAETEAQLHEVWQQFQAATSSVGFRLLEAYRLRVRWMFPAGARRSLPYRSLRRAVRWSLDRRTWRPGVRMSTAGRRLYDLGRTGIWVIRNEGWKSVWRRAKRRLAAALGRRPAGAGPPLDYRDWITMNEPDQEDLDQQRKTALKLPYRPLISIITPTWDPPPDSLRQTIESVLAQTYGNWELCIVDGGSKQPAVRETLEGFAAHDGRIRVKFLKDNLGISGNSNEALALARGEFVTFLDHTDVLAPFALFEVIQLVNRDPGLDCIYSDTDLLSEDGASRFNPFFTPEWSPDMLLSANYMAHLSVIRRAIVEELGGLRGEMDGAQDWDFLLRLSERTERIARIPKILYHCRADATSTVTSLDNKPYALAAQERAVQEHLNRRGLPGQVVRDKYGALRVKWQVSGRTKVSIIIPTMHSRHLLEKCLRGIAQSSYPDLEVLVVDTAGSNEAREAWYRQWQAKVPLRVLWWEKPFNYSAVNNWAAGQSQGNALLFLNDDTEALTPDWLEELVGWLEQPGVGAVGAQLLAEDGTIQHGGDVVGLQGFAGHLFTGAGVNEWTLAGWTRWYRNFLAVTGACLLVRRDLFGSIGGFDETFILVGSDVDFCIRVHRSGYRNVCTPFAPVVHLERATRGSDDPRQDYYTSFWHSLRYLHTGDPYFNLNLSPFSPLPKLRHPDEPTPLAALAPVLGRNLDRPRQESAEEVRGLGELCVESPQEVEATRRLHRTHRGPLRVASINWFIEKFDNPFSQALHTILRSAAHFRRHRGVSNRFLVLGTGPEPYIRSGLKIAFSELGEAEIQILSPSDFNLQTLPSADVSIATSRITAYMVSKFRHTKRKFYIMQDLEPPPHPAVSMTNALTEATFRLGLYGIVNDPTLPEIYESTCGGKAVAFMPFVDSSLFYPPGFRRVDEPFTVFVDGNRDPSGKSAELALETVRRLKEHLKGRVRVVSAGAWAGTADGANLCTVVNLSPLNCQEAAQLYRTCDAALVLSKAEHPSRLRELMACGVLVVSDADGVMSWLLRDSENCLLTEPTAEKLCAALERGLLDLELRERLTAQAVADIREQQTDWALELDRVFQFLSDPETVEKG